VDKRRLVERMGNLDRRAATEVLATLREMFKS
jgi:hypothetical protein